MKRLRLSSQIKKVLPVIAATTVLSACIGQEGSTNGGFSGVGTGASALGVVGGVVLVGALLADDDDSGGATAVGGSGTIADGGDGDGDGAGGADGGDGAGGADGGDGDGAGGADGGDGDGAGGADGGDGDGADGGDGDGAGPDDDDGVVTGDPGTILTADGSFVGDIFSDETLPQSNVSEVGMSDLQFNFTDNTFTGCVFVPPGSTPEPVNPGDLSAVTLMIGPPGANGFPGIELEAANADRTKWAAPSSLSAAQMNVLAENLQSGNLYLAVRNNEFPDGLLRRQILSPNVFQFATTTTSDAGGTADGFVLVNEVTGDYSITWNTDDPTLTEAYFIDGFPGDSQTVVSLLTQRMSNTARFFLNGNVNAPNDPIPNLEALLDDGMAALEAIGEDGERVFQGLLTKEEF